MASYLITGVSRGIGFEFLRQLSKDPANTVVGLVRDKARTERKIATELSERANIHLLQGDITDYDALKKATDDTAEVLGGRLDYLIANAGLMSQWSLYDEIGVLADDPVRLESDLLECFKFNVIGNIHLFNLFLPLILKGETKKVIAISSGMGDTELAAKHEVLPQTPYSISKAGVNMAVAKFSAQYAKDGVLFMSICPGAVDTGVYDGATEEQGKKAMALFQKFQTFAPHFMGHVPPESAVTDILSVIDRATVTSGYAGSFVSHYGNKQWL